MKRASVLGTLFMASTLAACTTMSARPTAAWLVGTWLMMAPDLEFPLACASGLPIQYAANGTYSLFGEEGVWRLEGDLLTETATRVHEDVGDPEETQIGRPYVSRIAWRGRNRFAKRFADGAVETFRRCPPAR